MLCSQIAHSEHQRAVEIQGQISHNDLAAMLRVMKKIDPAGCAQVITNL
jgi:hypothetical protein